MRLVSKMAQIYPSTDRWQFANASRQTKLSTAAYKQNNVFEALESIGTFSRYYLDYQSQVHQDNRKQISSRRLFSQSKSRNRGNATKTLELWENSQPGPCTFQPCYAWISRWLWKLQAQQQWLLWIKVFQILEKVCWSHICRKNRFLLQPQLSTQSGYWM